MSLAKGFSLRRGAKDPEFATGSTPRGITLDSAGNIYTVNELSRSVSKITPDGTSTVNLHCVVKESLRLRPVLMLAGRELAAELQTETLSLPAGTTVRAAIWLINTRPDLYPEPLAFKPERFLGHPPTTYGWLAYGGGTRRCLGAAFAELQIRVVLRTIFGLRTLVAESDEMEVPRMRGITLTPPTGVRVIATPR